MSGKSSHRMIRPRLKVHTCAHRWSKGAPLPLPRPRSPHSNHNARPCIYELLRIEPVFMPGAPVVARGLDNCIASDVHAVEVENGIGRGGPTQRARQAVSRRFQRFGFHVGRAPRSPATWPAQHPAGEEPVKASSRTTANSADRAFRTISREVERLTERQQRGPRAQQSHRPGTREARGDQDPDQSPRGFRASMPDQMQHPDHSIPGSW